MDWVTYLGGAGEDGSELLTPRLASDPYGNLHLIGSSSGAGFPTTLDALSRDILPPGTSDAVYAKLNPEGRLLYATYLGGAGGDEGLAVAADARGSVRLAGVTDSVDFPLARAHQTFPGGDWDAFVAELHRPLDSPLLLATQRIDLKQGVQIESGDALLNLAGGELDLNADTFAPTGFRLTADVIRIKKDARVQANAFFNQLELRGQLTGVQVTPWQFPELAELPPFEQPQQTSGPDVIVAPGESRHLEAGAWGRVTVSEGATLLLTGGTYDLVELDLALGSSLLAEAVVRVRLAERLKTAQGVRVGPVDGSSLSGADLLFFAAAPVELSDWSIDLAKESAGRQLLRLARRVARRGPPAKCAVCAISQRAVTGAGSVPSGVRSNGWSEDAMEDGSIRRPINFSKQKEAGKQ